MKFMTSQFLLVLLISVNLLCQGNNAMEIDDNENDDIPRVKIRVFRGPNEEKNGERFATWGFWIKQPSMQ